MKNLTKKNQTYLKARRKFYSNLDKKNITGKQISWKTVKPSCADEQVQPGKFTFVTSEEIDVDKDVATIFHNLNEYKTE